MTSKRVNLKAATDHDLLTAVAQGDDEAFEDIQRRQGTVQDGAIVHFLQAGSFVNPEQRTRFVQLIRGRIETDIQACPPWMRSDGQSRLGGSGKKTKATSRRGSNGKS